MKELHEHIESLKRELARLQPLSTENQQRLEKKFRLEWNYNSNHIEGNTLTYGETELLLIFGETKGNHEFREYEEMKGHDLALKLVEQLATDTERNLTENFIRELNQAILKEPFYKEAITEDGQPTRRLIKIGEYKSFPNSVRLQNGEIFNYASPAETPAMMSDLMNWYNTAAADKTQSTAEVAAELHYRFVCIHPFDDGNGRISRLLMNYHLIKNGYPPVIIKTEDKKNYLFALHEADTGNLKAFKKYIAEQLVWSYEISIKAAKGESIEEKEDLIKEIEVFKRGLQDLKNTEIKKSYASIKNIWDNGLKNLFQELATSFSHYNSLFKIIDTIYFRNDDCDLYVKKYSHTQKEIDYIDQLIHETRISSYNILNSFGVLFDWCNYVKADDNKVGLKVVVKIIFNDYSYKIFSEPYPLREKEFSYSEYITIKDTHEIVTFLGKKLLEEIKQKTNSLKRK